MSGPALEIRTALIAPALSGAPYTATLATTGGNGSQVSWSVVGGGLPPGITLGAGGGFSGSAGSPGAYTFVVRAANTSGQSDQSTLTLRVVAHDASRFDVTRVDVAAVPTSIAPHVQAAIDRWERAIRGDLAVDEIPRDFFSSTFCGGFAGWPCMTGPLLFSSVALPGVGTYHLTPTPIILLDGIFGTAPPAFLDGSGTLPLSATITVDTVTNGGVEQNFAIQAAIVDPSAPSGFSLTACLTVSQWVFYL